MKVKDLDVGKTEIDRRSFLKVAAISFTSISSLSIANEAPNSLTGKKPNLVFVFPDQLRVQAMGFMNEDSVITPNIDKFAAESKNFTNAVSNWPLCSPYRGMLQTGRWPYSTHVTTNCNTSVPDVYLRESEVTFTDVLNKSGYEVGYVGKWHLDTPKGYPKADRWQDAVWEAYNPPKSRRRHGITFWYAYGCNNRHIDPYYWIGNAGKDERYYPKEYSPAHEAKVFFSFLKNADGKHRDPEKPFAIFMAINPPHGPYDEVPEKYKKLFADKAPEELLNRSNVQKGHKPSLNGVRDYFAQVYGVDKAFCEILDAIDQAGLKEDTIVFFSSDHGEMMGSHGQMQKVVPYEESFRIPCLVRWPGKIEPGKDPLHINVPDYMPSLLSLMGMKEAIPTQVEGTDYSAAFLGKELKRPKTTFYMRCNDGDLARGVRTGRYTFIIEEKGKGKFNKLLFDNEKDKYQMNNIAEDKPEIVSELAKELNAWLEKTNDPYIETFRS